MRTALTPEPMTDLSDEHDAQRAWSVSLVAFGEPASGRTFSGYARSLRNELDRQGRLAGEFSCRQVRVTDGLAGAVGVHFKPWPRPMIRRGWMWSRRGNGNLTRRTLREIEAARIAAPLLQVGTLVDLSPLGDHYVLTDMTIPQAVAAGSFDIAGLGPGAVDEAIAIQKQILHAAQHTFTLTQWCRQSVVDDFGVDPSRVTPVYAGANTVDLDIQPAMAEHPELLFVGIDWERKGGPALVEAFRTVRRHHPAAVLRIVGCTPPVDEPGVVIEGFLDKSDPHQRQRLAEAFSRAWVFCLPARFDPFPNVIIEAASLGLPTVAYDNGSRREAIDHGRSGFLAKDGDVADFARGLLDLLADPQRCRAMGARAKARVARDFSWPAVVDRIGEVMQTRDRL